jgi:DNA-binding NarL/FixJ family response regulator
MDRVFAIERKATPASRAAVARAIAYLRTLGLETGRLTRAGKEAEPDFILLGAGDAQAATAELERIRARAPRARVMVALDTVTTKGASDVYRAGATVVAPAAAFPEAVRNAVTGNGRVEERASPSYRTAAERPAAPVQPLDEGLVEAFHDPDTGRLDAERVAAAYGVSLSALARALRITQSALSKRPTAAAAQLGLRELEFTWATLRDLLETDARVRAWLNAKSRHLNGRAPIDLLTHGSAEALANYVRSVIAGEPG